MNKLIIIFCFACGLLFLGSCNNLKTPFGIESSMFKTFSLTLSNTDSTTTKIFSKSFSYQDQTQLFTMSTQRKLIVGNFHNSESRILVRMIDLPKRTDVDTLFHANLSFKIRNLYPRQLSSLKLHIAPIDGVIFHQNEANWEKYQANNFWSQEGGNIDQENTEEYICSLIHADSLKIELKGKNLHVVQKWIQEGNFQTNYGFIIYTEKITDNLLELYSVNNNHEHRPKISFNYLSTKGDTLKVTKNTSYDTFIYQIPQDDLKANELRIANIPAQSIYMQISLPYSVFNNSLLQSDRDLKKINIISANLLLTIDQEKSVSFKKDRDYYITATMPTEADTTQFEFGKSYAWSVNVSQSASNSVRQELLEQENKLSINITNYLQGFLSASNIENRNGIVLWNNFNGRDFTYLSIYGPDATEVQNRPQLVIKYSLLNK